MVKLPVENIFLRRSKGLIHALIISLSLNIGLIATFSYFVLKEKTHKVKGIEEVKYFKPLSETNAEVLRKYFSYSFADLVKELDNKKLVEEGCRHCDLSLGSLVSFHHLDLDRALSGFFIQKRYFTFHHADKGWISLTLFPGLNEDGKKAIEMFLREEIWPFTAQGLFIEMKKRVREIPTSLQEAFFLTEHFHLIDLAFKQFPYFFPKEVLLELMLDGEWETLLALFTQIKNHPERKIVNLGAFLSSYLNNDSKLAAHLLVLLENDFSLKQTEDEVLLKMLSLLGDRTIEIENFLKKVIVSLRSDEIRQKAGEQLFCFLGEKPPTPYDHEQTLMRFACEQEKIKEPLQYTVKKGDSLWKIAQNFQISVKSLKELNNLKEGALKVGYKLLIPEKENGTDS